MQLQDLGTFVTVAAERSFSVAAKKLHRTQPAVSQAIRRLEEELGDRLFDRSVRNGALTEAGRLLQEYASRLLTLAADAEVAVRELQQVRRGRVIVGANEAAVHSLLPYLDRFAKAHPQALVEVRRVRSRAIAAELLNRTPRLRRPHVPAGGSRTAVDRRSAATSWSCWRIPKHPLAGRRRATIEEVGQQTVIAHNDPSPARERVLRAYERRHTPINIQMALPSLDGIKRAVEMGMGVAVLPRRCALSEIANGQLVAIKVPGLSARPSGPSGLPPRRAVACRRRVPRHRANVHDTRASADTRSAGPQFGVRIRSRKASARDGLDFLEPIEQQRRRIPRAVEERVTRGGRQLIGESVRARRARCSAERSIVTSQRRIARRSVCISVSIASVRRRRRRAGRARPSCRRRSRRTIRRSPRGCRAVGSPAARARARIRSRNWR